MDRKLATILACVLPMAVGCSTAPARSRASLLPNELSVWIGYAPRHLIDNSQSAPRGQPARQHRLAELFAAAGCPEVHVGGRNAIEVGSVVCRLPGSSPNTILVRAGFARLGQRSEPDGWLAAALLPSLYSSIAAVDRTHNYVFVAYDQSQGPVKGPRSEALLEALAPDAARHRVVAVVDLHTLRSKRVGAWRSGSDLTLYRDFLAVSGSLQIPISNLRVRGPAAGEADTPTILIGVIGDWIGEYLDCHRLMAAYLGYLDQTLAMRQGLDTEPPTVSASHR
jgi:hypothetical protein